MVYPSVGTGISGGGPVVMAAVVGEGATTDNAP